jgi:uncharacterized protein YbaR (Trm112 family)
MSVPPELLALLVCPKCKGALEHRAEVPALACRSCRVQYPIRDDIPIMLVDEAVPLG